MYLYSIKKRKRHSINVIYFYAFGFDFNEEEDYDDDDDKVDGNDLNTTSSTSSCFVVFVIRCRSGPLLLLRFLSVSLKSMYSLYSVRSLGASVFVFGS